MRAATRAFSAWFVMPWLSAAIASSGAAVAAPEAPEERVREKMLDKEEARSRLKEKSVTDEQIRAVQKEFEPKPPPRPVSSKKRSKFEQSETPSSKTGLAPLKTGKPGRVDFLPEGAESLGQHPKEHHDHHHPHKERHQDVCDRTLSAGEAERCEKARDAREKFEPGGGKTGPRKE